MPRSESSNESVTCASRSAPFAGADVQRPGRGRAEEPAEQVAEVAQVDVAEVEPLAGPRVEASGRRPSAEPNVSYCLRFSGSDRTSYAAGPP